MHACDASVLSDNPAGVDLRRHVVSFLPAPAPGTTASSSRLVEHAERRADGRTITPTTPTDAKTERTDDDCGRRADGRDNAGPPRCVRRGGKRDGDSAMIASCCQRPLARHTRSSIPLRLTAVQVISLEPPASSAPCQANIQTYHIG